MLVDRITCPRFAAACSVAALPCSSGCDPSVEGSNPGSTATSAEPSPDREPAARVPDDWETFVDPSGRVSFRYPPDLGLMYIHAVDWPPQPAVERGPFMCSEAGDESARAGRSEATTVDGRTYCVTRVTEGAAGSVYTLYAYEMPVGDDVVILTFSVRAVQCGHHDEPSRTECEREREAFSMDPIADEIARTLRIDG